MPEERSVYHKIECLLFVAGDPVAVTELARVFEMSTREMRELLRRMEACYVEEARGIRLLVTEDTVQMTSNADYIDLVEELLQPEKTKSVSKSMLETLAIVAYRQPVSRADIEEVRGVRCEYAVSQLLKLGLIMPVGHKDTPGRAVLFGTTDKFLHRFGLHTLDELEDFSLFSEKKDADGEALEV